MTVDDTPTPACIVDHDATLVIEAVPDVLLDEPLDYILADHGRKRSVCAALLRIASARKVGRMAADSLANYLRSALRSHHADEENDLFPALRRRLAPEDDLGLVLARLGEDHRRSDAMIDALSMVLTQVPSADPVRLSAAECEMLQAYASAEQQHLALENGVVMGIARIRLTRGDLKKISDGMKARRGVKH
jgi:hemerythrin-like domain-containing protein